MKYITSLLLAVLLGSAACSKNHERVGAVDDAPIGDSQHQMKSPAADLKLQLQQESGISLPDDAEVIRFEKIAGSDLLIRSQVVLDKAAFESWLATFELKAGDFSEEKRYLLGPDTGWWDPTSVDSLPTAQVMFENGTVLNLAYSDIDANQVKVYLVFHGT